MKNENKGDEMVEILTHLHQYIPSVPFVTKSTLETGEVVEEEKANIRRIIIGGDQLTAARIRSGQRAKQNAESPVRRLEGIIPAAEDWHTKANFLGVC